MNHFQSEKTLALGPIKTAAKLENMVIEITT